MSFLIDHPGQDALNEITSIVNNLTKERDRLTHTTDNDAPFITLSPKGTARYIAVTELITILDRNNISRVSLLSLIMLIHTQITINQSLGHPDRIIPLSKRNATTQTLVTTDVDNKSYLTVYHDIRDKINTLTGYRIDTTITGLSAPED